MLDYLAIGHIAQDITPDGYRLGGTASYAALTAHALGLRTGILTAAAEDAPMDELAPLDVCRSSSPQSTVYENRYTPEGRVQTLRSRAESISTAAVPREWQSAKIVHLAPIANEVDYALVDHFAARRSPTSPDVGRSQRLRTPFIGLTPQGWMRRWDSSGRVTRGEWAEAASLLNKASASVISVEDVANDWELIQRWAAESKVFVATEGEQGATVFWKGERRRFPASVVNVIDVTGAGDIFAACFFAHLWRTGDAWDAVKFAIALATDSVTRIGIDGVPTQSAIRNTLSAISHTP
jgi:sugar/nucleoside kinase (ribokinase family)